MFTSGIVSTREGRKIALFFSGRQHAGENLEDVLAQRAADLTPPIQMCDALSRNLPGSCRRSWRICLAHGRRQFVDVATVSRECRYVLESLCRLPERRDRPRAELSAEERLAFHQAAERSDHGPELQHLAGAAVRGAAGRAELGAGRGHLVPAEALGAADAVPARAGAPLDNNICDGR